MEYEFHPLADLFPMMSDEEIDALGEDMLANGQRESIALFDEKILDGRNRYRACLLKGIEPRFINQHPADPVAFVASANLHRRHLDESQRAMIAAKLATMKRGDNQHAPDGRTSQARAAELLDVGRRSVGRAREVIDHGVPELAAAVKVGDVSVAAAAAFVHDHPPTEQTRLIAKAGSAAAAIKIHRDIKIYREKKAKADRAAAAKEQEGRQPKLITQFTRTDGQVKAACDYNPEDPGDVAESDTDTPEMIRHRIFMYRATEALRLAHEFGFEKASAHEITSDVIDAVLKTAEAWSDLTSRLQQR
jgi:hypothetical protein